MTPLGIAQLGLSAGDRMPLVGIGLRDLRGRSHRRRPSSIRTDRRRPAFSRATLSRMPGLSLADNQR